MTNDASRTTVAIPDDAPNLFLTGFMGTGKSVVGRRIARQLDLPFIDSDAWISECEGMDVAEIFARRGEAHFRELERRFVESEMPRHRAVISCGGGLITNPELLRMLKGIGVVVVFFASPETIYERISGDTQRPLMQVEDPQARIRELLAQRESFYKDAGVGIMTDGHTISQVADHVIRIYLDKIGSA